MHAILLSLFVHECLVGQSDIWDIFARRATDTFELTSYA